MEMHLLHRRAMNRRLCFAEPSEHLDGFRLAGFAQCRSLDGCENLLQVMVFVRVPGSRIPVRGSRRSVRVLMHAKFGRRHTGLDHPVGGHVPALNGKTPQRAFELVERQTRVEQRAENHVAGGAGETVEVQDLHRLDSSLKLKYVVSPRMM